MGKQYVRVGGRFRAEIEKPDLWPWMVTRSDPQSRRYSSNGAFLNRSTVETAL
jgi:hypothetical protein